VPSFLATIPFRIAAFGAVGAALLGAALLPACSGTSGTESVAPVTGITVRAETVTAGKGCGRGGTQVFKYGVVVLGRNPATNLLDAFVAGNVYDCFADGTFVDLPETGGSFQYGVAVYAYNEAAYRAAGGDGPVRAAMRNPTTIAATNPTWSTKCDALQLELVQSLAVCDPLEPTPSPSGPASVVVATAAFQGEAGVLRCDSDYVHVVSRYSVNGGAPSVRAEAPCSKLTTKGVEPINIVVSPAVAPASYLFEVALLRGDGSAVGQTTCAAVTSPGLASSAVCQPVR